MRSARDPGKRRSRHGVNVPARIVATTDETLLPASRAEVLRDPPSPHTQPHPSANDREFLYRGRRDGAPAYDRRRGKRAGRSSVCHRPLSPGGPPAARRARLPPPPPEAAPPIPPHRFRSSPRASSPAPIPRPTWSRAPASPRLDPRMSPPGHVAGQRARTGNDHVLRSRGLLSAKRCRVPDGAPLESRASVTIPRPQRRETPVPRADTSQQLSPPRGHIQGIPDFVPHASQGSNSRRARGPPRWSVSISGEGAASVRHTAVSSLARFSCAPVGLREAARGRRPLRGLGGRTRWMEKAVGTDRDGSEAP